ncbi:HDOD domain-containing protein [Alteromonas oceanisediminis]|uniref:HDOD domain-containing protein n=1 Tax=Alteromonas oceanisediminis TaxID=2836180 RepID=UPI001BDA7661|nr:HDOD domain-containing protein [Alteromonas oceanisediminis]MBT0585629.1 HDOD domain-containing protein [Alteromonas oceanisediminis]
MQYLNGFPSLIYKNIVEIIEGEFHEYDKLDSHLRKVNLSKLNDEITFVKYEYVQDLFERVCAIKDSRATIAWIISRLSAQSFGVLGYLLVSAQNASEWRAIYAKYAKSFGWHTGLIKAQNNQLVFSHELPAENNHLECSLPICLCLRLWHISNPYNATSLTLSTSPTVRDEVESGFQIRRGSQLDPAYTIIEFSPHSEKKFLLGSNDRFRRLFQEEVDLQLKVSGKNVGVVAKVREILRQQESLQAISLRSTAEALHMSERTLNRQLTEQNTTYKEVVSAFRNKLSLELLFSGKPIATVAERVGFSERSTFERAFKKWQGFTPAQMQASYSLLACERKVTDIIHPDNIPNLPVTATRLLKVLNQDESHLDELVNIVSQDSGLVAKVMQIAGSAMYANSHVSTLKQAILGVFGTEKLKALALMLLSSRLFSLDKEIFDTQEFWLSSLATAELCEDLGKTGAFGKQSGGELYFTGLFYDIGSLFIAHCLPSKFASLRADTPVEFTLVQAHELQLNRLGISSPQASAFLSSYWNLPNHLTQSLKALAEFSKVREQSPVAVRGIISVASSIRLHLKNRANLPESRVPFCAILQQHMKGLNIKWSLAAEDVARKCADRIEVLSNDPEGLR